MNLTLGALFGYSSVNSIDSLKVPPSQGLSSGLPCGPISDSRGEKPGASVTRAHTAQEAATVASQSGGERDGGANFSARQDCSRGQGCGSPEDDTGPIHYVIFHRCPTNPLWWVALQPLEIDLDEPSPCRCRHRLPTSWGCVVQSKLQHIFRFAHCVTVTNGRRAGSHQTKSKHQ